MNITHKNYRFAAVIERRESSYVAYCPQLEEAGHVDGLDLEEVLAILKSAVGIVIGEMIEAGEEIPQSEQVIFTTVAVEIEEKQAI